MELQRKLEILADAAKYDASCASSGTELRDSSDGKGLGSTAPGMGICHSYAPDGRCISLLKVLLTNACNYDCLYCVNRASSNVARARFTVDEVVEAHDRLLSPQLYRRPVSFLRHHPQRRLHHGAGGERRAQIARGTSLPRLHPSQDDSGSRRVPDHGGRQICRPPQHQYRDAAGDEPCEIRAGKKTYARSAAPWAGCGSSWMKRKKATARRPRPSRSASRRPGQARR